jgi:predicted nucleic acid-binding protein
MARLIDTSLWVDLTRPRSPATLKALARTHVDHLDACVAEPIVFELFRFASDAETRVLTELFGVVPLLITPDDLWSRAANLGRQCRKAGITTAALDLLISTVAIHHDAVLVTFDTDFEPIARATGLRAEVLPRPRS